MRMCESLTALIEGRLSSPDGRSELVELATRPVLEQALEAEVHDALGRARYERGAEEGRGCRDGHRAGRLGTAEGAVEFGAPQVAGRDAPFRPGTREHAKGRTDALEEPAVEMPARGLQVARHRGLQVARHRGRLPRRKQPTPAVAHRCHGAGRAALA